MNSNACSGYRQNVFAFAQYVAIEFVEKEKILLKRKYLPEIDMAGTILSNCGTKLMKNYTNANMLKTISTQLQCGG